MFSLTFVLGKTTMGELKLFGRGGGGTKKFSFERNF